MIIISGLVLAGSIIPAITISAQEPDGSFFTDDVTEKNEGISPLSDNETGVSAPESIDLGENQTIDQTLSMELTQEVDPLPEDLNMRELSKGHDIAHSDYLGPASKENMNTYLVDNEILTGEEIIDVGQLIDNQTVTMAEEPTIVEDQTLKEDIVDEERQTTTDDEQKTAGDDIGGQTIIIENKTINNETSSSFFHLPRITATHIIHLLHTLIIFQDIPPLIHQEILGSTSTSVAIAF